MLQNSEKNGTEEFGLVTPTPGDFNQYSHTDIKLSVSHVLMKIIVISLKIQNAAISFSRSTVATFSITKNLLSWCLSSSFDLLTTIRHYGPALYLWHGTRLLRSLPMLGDAIYIHLPVGENLAEASLSLIQYDICSCHVSKTTISQCMHDSIPGRIGSVIDLNYWSSHIECVCSGLITGD